MKSTTDADVITAYNRIMALRARSESTGVKTYKSQSALLESLDPQTLAAVALLLHPQKQKETISNVPTIACK